MFRDVGLSETFFGLVTSFCLDESGINPMKKRSKARAAYILGIEFLAGKSWKEAVKAFQWAVANVEEGGDKVKPLRE